MASNKKEDPDQEMLPLFEAFEEISKQSEINLTKKIKDHPADKSLPEKKEFDNYEAIQEIKNEIGQGGPGPEVIDQGLEISDSVVSSTPMPDIFPSIGVQDLVGDKVVEERKKPLLKRIGAGVKKAAGEAARKTIEEIIRTEKAIDRENIYLGKGVIYETAKRMDVLIGDGHLLCLGATGTGKTNTMIWMMRQDIAAGRSVIFLDPKGERKIVNSILDVVSMKECDRLKDLMILDPYYANYSAKFNPLYSDGMYARPDEIINRIMAMVPHSKEEFWRDMARRLFQVIVNTLWLIKDDISINYSLINDCVDQGSLDKIDTRLMNSKYKDKEYLHRELQYFTKMKEEYFAQIAANAKNAVSQMDIGLLKEPIGMDTGTTKRSDILKRLYSGEKVVGAIILPSMQLGEAAGFASKTIFAALQGYTSKTILENKIADLRIYIDEAREVITPETMALFTQARSAGVFVRMFSQSIEGLMSAVGENNAFELMQNCKYKLLHRCDSATTAEKLLEVLEDVVVQVVSQDQDGETRTMGQKVKIIEPYNVASLGTGEYFLILDGQVLKGYCPEVEAARNIVTDQKTERVGDKFYLNYNSLADMCWLEDDSVEKKRITMSAVRPEKIYKNIEASINFIINNNLGNNYVDSGRSLCIYGGKLSNEDMPGCCALAVSETCKWVMQESTDAKEIFFEDEEHCKKWIAEYLIHKGLIYKNIKYNKPYNISAVRVEYFDMNRQIDKNLDIDCWIINCDRDVKNDDFTLTYRSPVV